jgi:hypothetical protein
MTLCPSCQVVMATRYAGSPCPTCKRTERGSRPDRCPQSGGRVRLTVGEAVAQRYRCRCGKGLKVRAMRDERSYLTTLPQHNRSKRSV